MQAFVLLAIQWSAFTVCRIPVHSLPVSSFLMFMRLSTTIRDGVSPHNSTHALMPLAMSSRLGSLGSNMQRMGRSLILSPYNSPYMPLTCDSRTVLYL